SFVILSHPPPTNDHQIASNRPSRPLGFWEPRYFWGGDKTCAWVGPVQQGGRGGVWVPGGPQQPSRLTTQRIADVAEPQQNADRRDTAIEKPKTRCSNQTPPRPRVVRRAGGHVKAKGPVANSQDNDRGRSSRNTRR